MGAAGQARAEEFSWPRVTAKVEEYYGFVIRRLASQGALPADFTAEVPQAPPLRARPPAASSELVAVGSAASAAAADSAMASLHTDAE